MPQDNVNAERTKPSFRHDCTACTYLGAHDGQDLYHCLQMGALPTVIRRFSSEGPDYVSGMALADIDPVLAEARRRAALSGLTAHLDVN
jgi:hypothetical protein